MPPSPEREATMSYPPLKSLQELLGERAEALRRGESPSAEDLCQDQPEMVEVVERAIEALDLARLGIESVDPEGRHGAFVPAQGAEPLPGFRLVSWIGGGGSGEVWRAIGPGGFPVALKLVRLSEGGAKIETRSPEVARKLRVANLRSIELMRHFRHPNLMTMFGAWARDGLLIIGMELADRTLLDRFDEARAEGLSGIPMPELLDVMTQAARGIDHLNAPRSPADGVARPGVQHGDIKPHNLLMVGDAVKVGDFGLAMPLDSETGRAGSLTPSYAAPELYQGRISGRSDQYALAASYCQLRGGRLPFEGSPWVVTLGHCSGEPDLTMLPEPERPIVARALAKAPEDRWPDCRSFVAAIATAQGLDIPARPRATRIRPNQVALAGLVVLATITLAALAPRMIPAPPSLPPTPTSEILVVSDEYVEVTPMGSPETAPVTPEEPAILPNLAPNPIEVVASPPPPIPPPPATDPAPTTVIADESVLVAASVPPPSHPPIPDPPPPEVADADPAQPDAALLPRTATVEVRMPTADANLVVRGEVGKGQPDEWYGPRRVIHTPPLFEGGDYLIGAIWADSTGKPQSRNFRLRVEPGSSQEVDLRPDRPTTRPLSANFRPSPQPKGSSNENPSRMPSPVDGPTLRQ